MRLPFTTEQFFAIFGRYNDAVWPMQIVLSTLAVAFILLIYIRNKHSNALTSFGLAFFWAWMGIVYHILFFAEVNPMAVFFGAMYILQAFLFAYLAIKGRLQFAFRPGFTSQISAFLLIYALIIPVDQLHGRSHLSANTDIRLAMSDNNPDICHPYAGINSSMVRADHTKPMVDHWIFCCSATGCAGRLDAPRFCSCCRPDHLTKKAENTKGHTLFVTFVQTFVPFVLKLSLSTAYWKL